MIKTISFYAFERAFADYNRTENFTYYGLKALFDYLEQFEEDTGEAIELDVIGLCCDYTEYENLAEFHGVYSADEYPDFESIEDMTQVIRIDDTAFIIQDF